MNTSRTISPKSYKIGLYKDVRCLFISSDTIVIIPLSLLSISYLTLPEEDKDSLSEIMNLLCSEEIGYNKSQLYCWDSNIIRIRGDQKKFNRLELDDDIKKHSLEENITQILASLNHTPYSTFQIEGEYETIQSNILLYISLNSFEDLPEQKSPIVRNILFVSIEVLQNYDIVNISFCINDNKAMTYTMLPESQKYENITHFTDVLELIDSFMKIAITVDEIVSFDSCYKYIINVLKKRQPNYWENLKINTIDIYIDELDNLVIPTVEFVNLSFLSKRLFPYYVNHDLKTIYFEQCSKEFNKDIHRLKFTALMDSYRSSGIEMLENWSTILDQRMSYVNEKVEAIREIYKEYIVHRNIAVELCGLTSESWAESSEAYGIITKANPRFLLTDFDENQVFNVIKGLHFNVNIFMYKYYALDSFYKNVLIDEYIKSVASSDGVILKDCNYLYNQFMSYKSMFNVESYLKKVKSLNQGNIGNYGTYIYSIINEPKKFICYTYDVLIVTDQLNYSALNITDNYELYYNTGNVLFDEIPKRIERVICEEIALLKRQKNRKLRCNLSDKKNVIIKDLLLPSNNSVSLYDYIIYFNMKPKYNKYLQKREEKDYISQIALVNSLDKNFIRTLYPLSSIDLKIDYYVKLLKDKFILLNELMKL
jgi:hypothetical protein